MIRLLILDDDQTYLSLVRRAIKLENLESQATCVSNVSDFRQVFAEHQASIAVLLLDINLREDEDGIDVAAWVFQQTQDSRPKLQIQLQSFDPAAPDQLRAKALGLTISSKSNSFNAMRQMLAQLAAGAT
jgi:DNA-binding LytR/AlgR family response regulator